LARVRRASRRVGGLRPSACPLTTHCNGPAGRHGPCDSNAARCPAGR
jgi:hypothetical protein